MMTCKNIFFIFFLSLLAYPLQSKERPSVLFINIDDWNDWNSVLKGHPQAITPNLKRFAEKCVTFTRAICNSPVCFPSRTSVFSGIHPSRSGAISNPNWVRPWRNYVPNAVTIPKHFSTHGWQSVGIGKNFHKGDKTEFDQYIPRAGEPKATKETYVNLNNSAIWGIADIPESKMPDYLSVNEAIKSLQSHSDGLFLSLGIYRPHVRWIVPQKYFDMYPLESLSMPKTQPNDLEDLPERFKLMAHNEAKFGPGYHQKLVQAGHDKNKVRAYLASVSFADAQVGRILDAWYKSPLSKDGYVILWSDHGYQLSEKEGWSKMKPWFDSARVNLMISGPGLTKGEFCHKAVSLLDLYPTLIDLLDLPKPKQKLDGHSLVPLLLKPDTEWDKPVLMSSEIDGIRYDVVMNNDYRMTKLITGETELYKLTNDPHEFNNLANDSKYQSVINDLSQHLSFKHPKTPIDHWIEVENLPHQTSSDFSQRGNFHYLKATPHASNRQALCAELRKGEESYIDFVLNIDQPGEYIIDITLSSEGKFSLATSPVKNDAKQADLNFPMQKIMIKSSKNHHPFNHIVFEKSTFHKKGLNLLRLESQNNKQILLIDRLRLRSP